MANDEKRIRETKLSKNEVIELYEKWLQAYGEKRTNPRRYDMEFMKVMQAVSADTPYGAMFRGFVGGLDMIEEMETFGGWSNEPTRGMYLQMVADEASYKYFREIIKQAETMKEAGAYLKHNIAKQLPETSPIYRQLMRAGLDSIDWEQIAETLNEDGECR